MVHTLNCLLFPPINLIFAHSVELLARLKSLFLNLFLFFNGGVESFDPN